MKRQHIAILLLSALSVMVAFAPVMKTTVDVKAVNDYSLDTFTVENVSLLASADLDGGALFMKVTEKNAKPIDATPRKGFARQVVHPPSLRG